MQIDQTVSKDASQVLDGPEPSRMLLIIAGISLVALCLLGVIYVVPSLYGPYAIAFGDAGPVFLSRGFAMILFMVMPALFFANFIRSTGRAFVVRQVVTVVLWVAAFLGYGYYVHNIVHWQGAGDSLNFLVGEVGFQSVEHIPANVTKAFYLSDELAQKNSAPWLPGAWKAVAWPPMPVRQATQP